MSTEAIPQVQQKTGISRGRMLFTFLLGIFMGALDHGIVGPALSSIISAYQVSESWGVWSFTIYTLTFAVSIPVLGKLSDRLGRKQTFIFGISLFAIGSIIAAFASHFTVFLLGRAVQAIGSGGIFPITAAQIAVTTPPEKRGKALGLIGVAFGIGTIAGPSVGGLILKMLEWQWIFLINIPISILILLLVTGLKQEQPIVKKPIDLPGIILLSVVILAIMYGISSSKWIFILAGLVLIPFLLMIERKQADPLLNTGYFTRKNTVTLLVSSLISGFVMATSINFLPFFTESMLGMEKGSSGLLATPFAISSVIASLIGGSMADKIGAKKVLLLGFMISILGALSLGFTVNSLAIFVLIIVVMGFGVGIIIGAPLNVLILQTVEPKETGAAIGYLSLFRSLGSTLGATVAGKLIGMAAGFAYLFTISAFASAVSIFLIAVFMKKKQNA
ncbi:MULTISPECIES: MFS transporter [Brevibacillus]|uniref:MFS transporter n=1 Tax=Brevibacillus TaxID=55080 RepID=UPI00203C1158|nr:MULTISPECIES: MFS transporter [Brevibacillus]MCM3078542.1 MFS transporter [Brevibacillus invocatus]MCM3429206.1 MFS transporter [Brevibacillus invocatus]MDH4619438.1 MFS transporter [Brevibacillus sp. AY1]